MHRKPKIKLYSHGFAVEVDRPSTQAALNDFCYTLAEWEWAREHYRAPMRRQIKRIFATANAERTEYRFHINHYDYLFRTFLRYGIHEGNVEFEHIPLPKPTNVELRLNKGVKPTEEQEPVVDFLSKEDLMIKTCTLATGKGKTMSTLMALSRMGKRALIQLRGGFVDQWIEELYHAFSIKTKDILVIRGRDALISAMNQIESGELNPKIVFITWKTLFQLYRAYEQEGYESVYGISPEQIYNRMGIGVKVVDEVHLDFHLNFRSDIYTNVPTSIHLSATLDTRDPTRKRMYEIAFPYQSRYEDQGVEPYIEVQAIFYSAFNPNVLRTTERGSEFYSHTAFEKSILRKKKLTANYFKLIRWTFNRFYRDVYRGNQKCLIYCATVRMCEELVDSLRYHYPDMDSQVFVSETDEQVLHQAQVIVSTLGSCGTGKDIPDLRTVIMTTAVSKYEANRQSIGRIRKLKNYPEDTPYFCYFVCDSIDKHVNYHEQKIKQIKDIAIDQRVRKAPVEL